MRLGRSTAPSNRIKELSFRSSYFLDSNSRSNLQAYLQQLWTLKDDQRDAAGAEATRALLNAAVPLDALTFEQWSKKFLDKYSMLRMVNAIPAFNSPNYVKFPANSLTAFKVDLGDPIYDDYAKKASTAPPERQLRINANLKVNAFAKVVASVAWWSYDLFKVTVPLLDTTFTFDTGLAVGGPRYGEQQAFLDQNRNLSAGVNEVATSFSDAAFTLNLSAAKNELFLPEDGSRDWMWNGSSFESTPQNGVADFRSGLVVVRPQSRDSVTDALTGLFDNRFYLTTPDSDGLVSNVWTSVLHSPSVDYTYNYDSPSGSALNPELLLRYRREDPLYVSRFNPELTRQNLDRIFDLPSVYSSGLSDGFDYYDALASSDSDLQAVAVQVFTFAAQLSFLTTTLQRLFTRAGLDLERWGQGKASEESADLALLSAYQAPYYLAEALQGHLDPYYTQLLEAIAPSPARLQSLTQGDHLSLTSPEDLQLYLRFALASVPNLLGQDRDTATLRFSGEADQLGRLPLQTEEQRTALRSALDALGVDRLADRLAQVLHHYQIGIEAIADPRLVPALMAQAKYMIVAPQSGIIDQAMASNQADPQLDALERLHQPTLDSLFEPKSHDDKRFVALTSEQVTDLDASGNPVDETAIAVTLSSPAPAGGVVVPLLLSGSAAYGSDFAFEGESTFPAYAYVPFGESRILFHLDSSVRSQLPFNAVLSILDPSSSYSRSKDMDRVYLFSKQGENGSEIKIYDNDALVRLNTDPGEPESFYSPSAFDTSFDSNFYKDSTVLGIEAKREAGGQALRLYAHSTLPGVRRYSFSDPEPHPWGGDWLLLDDEVIIVQPGDNGEVPIREYYNSRSGDYYYTPAGQSDSRFLGGDWQDLGVHFSLRNFSPKIGFALGTLRTRVSSNLTYATYPTRDTLSSASRSLVAALGVTPGQISDVLYRYDVDARPVPSVSSHAPARPRYSATFDTASFAGSLWDQATGLAKGSAPALIDVAGDQVSPSNYNVLSRSGARFYNLSGFGFDTVAVSGAAADIADAGLSQVTLALVDGQVDLAVRPGGFVLRPAGGTTASSASQVSANVDLSFRLQPADATISTRLADDGFYLLPDAVPGLDPAAPSRELIQQYGLQLFQTSSAFESFLAPSASTPLFESTLQLPSATSYQLVRLPGSAAQGVLLAPVPDATTPGALHFEVPGAGTLVISIAAVPAGIDDYLARDQGLVPGLNFLGMPQSVNLRLDISREAHLTNKLGFYRAIDLDGGVRDALTGDTLYPGDLGYGQAALSVANTRNLPGDLTVAGDRGVEQYTPTIYEDAVLFPYARSSEGSTYFAFAAANPDGISHFRVIGRNTFGYEDLPASRSDFDYDDAILALRTQSL